MVKLNGESTVMQVVLEGGILERIKKAIILPFVDGDTAMKEPLEAQLKLEDYENGKKIFLTGVEIMAETLLPKLSLDSDKLVLTLEVKEV